MPRKITELDHKLRELGYRCESRIYDSQGKRIYAYNYVGKCHELKCYIKLNYDRTKVVTYGLYLIQVDEYAIAAYNIYKNYLKENHVI